MEVKAYSLAILGNSGVGKTSLSNRIIQNEFNKDEEETKGAEYFQKIFFYKGQTIKLDIYGTSGKEKFKKIAKYLYKDARSIFIMYKVNDRKSFEDLTKYIDNIRQNSVENPIIYIIGNFSDVSKESREVSFSDLKNFAQEEEFKYFEISCKTNAGINDLINELTTDILITGKWYISKIFKDLGDNAPEKNEKENEKLKKHLKNFLKEKKSNLIRCPACEKLLIVRFKTMFNEVSFICNNINCKFEKSVPITKVDKFMEDMISRIICNDCKKKGIEKYKLYYCPECKEYLCNSCEKNHEKKVKATHELFQYFFMDITCFNHSKKAIGFCKTCKLRFCSKCNKNHKKHEFIYFDDLIEQLTKENKDNIQKERKILNEFKNNCEDCIKTLKKIMDNFISIKEKEIKLKELLLFQLSNIQYNYELIDSVKNLRYIKTIKYDKNSDWDQKITDIFEVLGHPIQIKNINITKNKNNYVIPEKIRIGLDIQAPLEVEQKDITDICNMNNNKYMGVSYSNGSLELYDDNLIVNKNPFSIFQIMEIGQSINSIQKSTRNLNNVFVCGKYRIKNIEFYDNYKTYKTINEIVDEYKTFTLCLEQNFYYLTCDVFNKIEIFSKESKKLADISDCIDPSGSKHIISLNEISNDKIYITFNRISEANEGVLTSRSSLSNFDDMTLDFSVTMNIVKQQIDIGTKIIEFKNNRIKREFILPYKQDIIGVLNDSLILIRDEINGSVILFDVSTFKNSQRFYWDLGGKPIYIGILNKRVNLIDFILVDDQMNLFQNIYDKETKTITQIFGLKNQNKSLECDSETLKKGKIIQNPFKNVINYIGNNDFIVVNY